MAIITVNGKNHPSRIKYRGQLTLRNTSKRIGHKNCIPKFFPLVPKHMGWYWKTDGITRSKNPPGWKPGAILKTLYKNISKTLANFNPIQLTNLPKKTRVSEYQKISGSNVKPEKVDSSIVVQKKNGEVFIQFEPIRGNQNMFKYDGEDGFEIKFCTQCIENVHKKTKSECPVKENILKRKVVDVYEKALNEICEEIYDNIDAAELNRLASNIEVCECQIIQSFVLEYFLTRCNRSVSSCDSYLTQNESISWIMEFSSAYTQHDYKKREELINCRNKYTQCEELMMNCGNKYTQCDKHTQCDELFMNRRNKHTQCDILANPQNNIQELKSTGKRVEKKVKEMACKPKIKNITEHSLTNEVFPNLEDDNLLRNSKTRLENISNDKFSSSKKMGGAKSKKTKENPSSNHRRRSKNIVSKINKNEEDEIRNLAKNHLETDSKIISQKKNNIRKSSSRPPSMIISKGETLSNVSSKKVTRWLSQNKKRGIINPLMTKHALSKSKKIKCIKPQKTIVCDLPIQESDMNEALCYDHNTFYCEELLKCKCKKYPPYLKKCF